MKVKLDENFPLAVVELLVAHGHDVETIASERLGGATDALVLEAATREQRLLMTLDRGLGDVRRYPPGTHAGILILRLDVQSAAAVTSSLEELITGHDLAALSGTVAIAQRGLLRIRRR